MTVALAVVVAVAAFALVMPIVMIVDRPTPLGPPFPPQNQDAETLVYVLTFLVIAPLSLVAAGRLASAIGARAGAEALTALTGLLAASLAALAPVLKLAGVLEGADGVRAVLIAAVAWSLAAAAVLARAASRPWPALARIGRFAAPAWALAAAALVAALACFADLDSVSFPTLAVGVLLSAAVAAAYGRLGPRHLPRRWALGIELVVVAALLLAVPDLLVFRPEAAPGNLAISIETSIIRFHQDFLLGPANQVLSGGGAMLVDTASQYGVGSIYALVAWFLLAPIGYGTFALLDGILTALWFAAGYGVLRAARTPPLLAAAALAVGVVVLVFNLSYPVGALPQYGPLRFGLPMAVVLFEVAAERRPARSRALHVATLVVLGLSAVWSLEALAYTTGTYVAIAGMQAWLRPGPGRLRWLAARAGEMVLAWGCAHALFAGATLGATGRLPDWGEYLAYLHAFLVGPVGDLTYDIPRWSPGLAVGAAYIASAVAVGELARTRHPLMRSERTAMIALTGLTGYGIALLSYWVDRSQEHILIHVALPALLMAALWIGVLVRTGRTATARRGALGFGLVVASLVVAVAWSSVGDRFPRTALAHAAPGGESLRGAVRRLWHPPPLNSAAAAGQRMLAQYMPGERRSIALVEPDLAVEILVRSRRGDALALGDPWEASFVAGERQPALRSVIAHLRAGDRILTDENALAALHGRRSALAPLQLWAFRGIANRFRLRAVAHEQGFVVMELEPLRP